MKNINNYNQYLFENVFENIPFVSDVAVELDILESIIIWKKWNMEPYII